MLFGEEITLAHVFAMQIIQTAALVFWLGAIRGRQR